MPCTPAKARWLLKAGKAKPKRNKLGLFYIQLRYEQDGEMYGEEAFASVDPQLAASGAVLIRFDLPDVDRGKLELRFEDGYDILFVLQGSEGD